MGASGVINNGGGALSFRQETQWLQILCNQMGVKDANGNILIEDGLNGPSTIYAIRNLPLLKEGSRGAAVIHIQNLLKLSSDGVFGPNTVTAVAKWQALHRLSSDGIVGPNTWVSFA